MIRHLLPTLFIIIAILNCRDGAAVQHHLSGQLSFLEDAKPERQFNKIKDIPQTVLDAFGAAIGKGGGELRMADPGGPWNRTDVVTNPSLPSRRLIWAVEIKGYYVIHYEMGGVGYSTHYLIAAKDETQQNWKVFWSASAFKVARDYAAFVTELRNGTLDTDPNVIH